MTGKYAYRLTWYDEFMKPSQDGPRRRPFGALRRPSRGGQSRASARFVSKASASFNVADGRMTVVALSGLGR
jgi:hypothetical protein